MHLQLLALGGGDVVRHVGDRRNDIHIELPVETLLDDLHVQQPQESAPETESQRQRALGFEGERRIVQPQLLKRSAQVLVLVRLDGVDAGEDHRLHLLEAGDRLAGRIGDRGDRIAYLDLRRGLDARTDIAHVARPDLAPRLHLELQHAHLVGVVLRAGVDELHVVALANRAVEDTVVGYDAAERIEHRVEDQRLQGAVLIPLRGRNTGDDRLEHLLDAQSGLARREQDILLLAADQVDHLILHLVDHGRVHVDLVQHGDDLQIVPQRQIEVRDGLGLNALRGVDHQQRPLAGGDGPRNLVGEVDVSRRVDQIQYIGLSVPGFVLHLDGVALDGDALFALEVHVVQHLRLHFALRQRVGLLEQPVGQRTLAVVDVGDDAEVAYVFHCI